MITLMRSQAVNQNHNKSSMQDRVQKRLVFKKTLASRINKLILWQASHPLKVLWVAIVQVGKSSQTWAEILWAVLKTETRGSTQSLGLSLSIRTSKTRTAPFCKQLMKSLAARSSQEMRWEVSVPLESQATHHSRPSKADSKRQLSKMYKSHLNFKSLNLYPRTTQPSIQVYRQEIRAIRTHYNT